MRAVLTRATDIVTLASAVALIGNAPAQADTIYDFIPSVTLGSAGQPIEPFTLQLDLSGGFTPESIARNCEFGICFSQSGNFSDFSLSATIGDSHLATLDNVPDTAFEDTHGTIDGSSGSLFWGTDSSITLTLTFGNGVWNAVFNSDLAGLPDACYEYNCTAHGTLEQVPEPATFGLLATGLIAVGAAFNVRRRSEGSKQAVLF